MREAPMTHAALFFRPSYWSLMPSARAIASASLVLIQRSEPILRSIWDLESGEPSGPVRPDSATSLSSVHRSPLGFDWLRAQAART
jgi:hypothetical protein